MPQFPDRMTVTLKHSTSKEFTTSVTSIQEAVDCCRKFTTGLNVSPHGWEGGQVRDIHGNLLAQVTYDLLVQYPSGDPVSLEPRPALTLTDADRRLVLDAINHAQCCDFPETKRFKCPRCELVEKAKLILKVTP